MAIIIEAYIWHMECLYHLCSIMLHPLSLVTPTSHGVYQHGDESCLFGQHHLGLHVLTDVRHGAYTVQHPNRLAP